MKSSKKLKTYEAHVPMPYCEIHIVKAESAAQVHEWLEDRTISDRGYCIGEIASRKRRVIRRRDYE